MLTQEIKDIYVARAMAHQAADDFEKGHYWDGKKGCAVGCLAHDDDKPHETLARELSTPEFIFYLADEIFEGLPLKESKQWPVDFMQAMPVGLSPEQWDKQIKAPFLIYVLDGVLDTFDHDKIPDVKAAIDGSIALWRRDDIGSGAFNAAAEAVAAAADAAAWGAEAAGALRAAEAAAWAAEAAVEAAADAAGWAAGALRDEKYKDFANKLLELMREAKP
jgi:hypothetical protein